MDRIDLLNLRQEIEQEEDAALSPYATRSTHAVREHEDIRVEKGHRLQFAVDADRILHSLAYTRYIDKTQVFSLIPNDHLTHRVLHVQLVSKIARTVGRFLRLNLDLIEAIALGHDLGHPPFGHDGERILTELCREHGLPCFLHSVQGVRFMRSVEKKGLGCNLSLQVLDGILCHDGETHNRSLEPERYKDFATLDREMADKQRNPSVNLRPMTMEGCVVCMCDVISYIGRDIEDAIRIGLIARRDIPEPCRKVLGETNGTIVYALVEDIISTSFGQEEIAFSEDIARVLGELREFNYRRIYMNPVIKTESERVKRLYRALFEGFLEDLYKERKDSRIYTDFLNGMSEHYIAASTHAEIVRDFMAGMTDAYFLRCGEEMFIPQELPSRFDRATCHSRP